MHYEMVKKFKKGWDPFKISHNNGAFWDYCNGYLTTFYMYLLLGNDPDMLHKVHSHLPGNISDESQIVLQKKKNSIDAFIISVLDIKNIM